MSTQDLIVELQKMDVELWVENDKLRYSAPPGVITDDHLQQLVDNKVDIVEWLQRAVRAKDTGVESMIAVSRNQTLPASFAQERLWFLDHLEPGNPAYIVPQVSRLKGELRVDILLKSLQIIVSRHESLRTRFADSSSGPILIIDDQAHFELTQEDLSALDADKREREVLKYMQAEKSRRFDLAQDFLFRGKLLRLRDDEHVLILTLHHIICDGWSLGVLFSELGKCYVALSEGRQPALAELSIQYADFALWQRCWLSGAELDRQLNYWRAQLEDLQVLDLPTDQARPAIHSYDGANESLTLDRQTTEQIEQLSKDAGATLFMTMLSVYVVMLQRYCAQDDIVIGTPIANRNRSEVEGLIGFFVNMLVMRVDCSGSPDFISLVKRVSDVALGAYEHQDIPFEKLVDALQVDRDPSRNPLFQVQFALQNASRTLVPPRDLQRLQSLTFEPVIAESQVARFDLECHIWKNRDDDLLIDFVYNTQLFEASTIERMLRHYANLLEAVVANPDQAVDLLPLQGREEMDLLRRWNETHQDYPRDVTLLQMFEAQVERSPQAIALEFEDQVLSFRELDQCANALARRLQENGVGRDRLVGVYMLRSLEMVISLIAIWKAGGAYVPLDPEYPRDRIAYMVDETKPAVVLTQAQLQSELPPTQAAIIDVDHAQLADSGAVEPLGSAVAGVDDLAYVIYTSGSTGNPKGVMNCHRGIVNRLQWMQHHFPLAADDRVLQKTPFSFDVSLWEFFWPLIMGARLVVARPDGHKDPQYLSRLIRDRQINNVHFVPSMLKAFLDYGEAADFSGVKRVFCSGEGLGYELQEQFFNLHDAELHNFYGPTEAAIEVSHWACRRGDERRLVPIGRPTPNSQLHVLDRQMQPVPIGVRGELYIGGVQVAQGYLGQPELTAEKFVPDPFSDAPGARLYRTGDLARYLPDGAIEYLGRNDHQVKLRGFRIELGEIEAVLKKHASVREAVVLCQDDEIQGRRLVAYLVADGPDAPTAEILRAFARSQLPDFMIPAAFMVLDSFPLTSSGKLNPRALPAPDGERQTGKAFVEPRSDLERQLADVWREVLGVAQVGIHDNFFDLGGHSLKLVGLSNRLSEDLDAPVTVLDLFTYPTVSALAEHIMRPRTDEDTGEADRGASLAAGKQRLQKLRQRRQDKMGIRE